MLSIWKQQQCFLSKLFAFWFTYNWNRQIEMSSSKQFPNIKDWVFIVSDSPNKHARLHSNCHKCLHFNLLVISGQKSVDTRGCYKHTRICIHLLTCPVLTLWVWGFCLRQCQQGSLCAAETGVWQGRKLSSVRVCTGSKGQVKPPMN